MTCVKLGPGEKDCEPSCKRGYIKPKEKLSCDINGEKSYKKDIVCEKACLIKPIAHSTMDEETFVAKQAVFSYTCENNYVSHLNLESPSSSEYNIGSITCDSKAQLSAIGSCTFCFS